MARVSSVAGKESQPTDEDWVLAAAGVEIETAVGLGTDGPPRHAEAAISSTVAAAEAGHCRLG